MGRRAVAGGGSFEKETRDRLERLERELRRWRLMAMVVLFPAALAMAAVIAAGVEADEARAVMSPSGSSTSPSP
jgi:hypothetical protein